MTSKGLSFKEICAIIKIAGSNGVSELRFGGLDVTFHALAPQKLSPPNPEPIYFAPDPSPAEVVAQEPEDDEDRLAQDLITDPEAHELEMIERASQE